jgi:long-chain fatty acid transport protein
VSVVVPGGLTKRWNDSPAVDRAEEFSLQVVEVNPTAAFRVTDDLAVAFGFRIVSSSGVVKSSSSASRDLMGDSIDFGYNVALAYKPMQNLEVGITYRSNVDLTVEGNAKLDIGSARVYDGGASVTVPLPATLSAAIAYTLPTKTTLEFVYERAYWSAYSSLDFNYVSVIPTILQPSFDASIAKNWKDVNAYRLGITQEMDTLTLMAGVVYGETPVPEETISFELPDSASLSVSLGARYALSDSLDVGLSALYSMPESRDVTNDDLDGEFSNSNVLLVSAGVGYKF